MISWLVQTFLVLNELEEDPQGWLVQDCTMIGKLFGWFKLALVQGLLWLIAMPDCPTRVSLAGMVASSRPLKGLPPWSLVT